MLSEVVALSGVVRVSAVVTIGNAITMSEAIIVASGGVLTAAILGALVYWMRAEQRDHLRRVAQAPAGRTTDGDGGLHVTGDRSAGDASGAPHDKTGAPHDTTRASGQPPCKRGDST